MGKRNNKGATMRRISFLLVVLFLDFMPNAYANVITARINAANTTIPTSFSTAGGSLVLQGVRNMVSILIDNRTAAEVAVNCSQSPTWLPSDTSVNNIYVDTLTKWVIDNASLSGTCYIRSMGSAITTGIVTITVTGY